MLRQINAIVILALAITLSGTAAAETWRLDEAENWQEVPENRQDQYALGLDRIKKLVSSKEPAAEELAELKEIAPEPVRQELDAFLNAELLLAKNHFDKASGAYEKFLNEYPRSELFESALDRQFQIASAYLAGRKRTFLKIFKVKGYREGVRIMEKIASRAGDAQIARRALTAVAKSYEERKKYVEAYEIWSQISSTWPGGEMEQAALLGMAQNMHAAYRGPKYDATSLISAKSYYQEFQLRYPKYAEDIGVKQILADIEEQLALKQYTIGKYYDKTDSKLAANLYYQNVVENWPNSMPADFVEQANQKESNKEVEK